MHAPWWDQFSMTSTYCPIEQTQSLVYCYCSWFDTIITMPGYYHDPFYRSLLEETRYFSTTASTSPSQSTKFLINPWSGEGKHKSLLYMHYTALPLYRIHKLRLYSEQFVIACLTTSMVSPYWNVISSITKASTSTTPGIY